MQTKKQWNISTRPVRNSHIYVAFPGMGKTTYALHHSGVVDLDFGAFRSALGVSPARQSTIYSAFVKFANTYTKGGYTVLTNDPGLIPFFKQDGYQVTVSLPSDEEDLVKRVLARHSNPAFDKQLELHANEWIEGWVKTANRYGAKIVRQRYFSIPEGGLNANQKD